MGACATGSPGVWAGSDRRRSSAACRRSEGRAAGAGLRPGAPMAYRCGPHDGGAPAFGPGTNGVQPPPGPPAATCVFRTSAGPGPGRRAPPARAARPRAQMLAVADFTPEEAEEVPFLKGDSVLLHLDEEAPVGGGPPCRPGATVWCKTFFVASPHLNY